MEISTEQNNTQAPSRLLSPDKLTETVVPDEEEKVSEITYENYFENSVEGKARFNDAYKVLEMFNAAPTLPKFSQDKVESDKQKEEYKQKVLDEVLERKRGFEISSISMGAQANKIFNAPPEQLEAYQRTIKNVEAMPDFYEEGGAPAFDAITEGLWYGVSDPINIVGIALGVFSAGSGTAATFGGKTAAKEGVKQYVKNKIKFITSKPMLKVAAVDSAVTGTGQVAAEAKRQKTEIEVGVRDKIDRGEMLLTGALMGPGSVVIGQTLSVAVGASVRASSAGVNKVLPETAKESIGSATNWLTNNLLPKSFRDKISLEIAEEVQGASNAFNQSAIKVASALEKDLNKAFKSKADKNKAIDTVNKLLDGDEPQVNLPIKTLELVNQAKILIKQAQEYATSTPNLKSAFRAVFKEGDDYGRFVYEVFSVSKRAVPFKQFLSENKEVIKELTNEVINNPQWFEALPKAIKRNLTVKNFTEEATSTKAATSLAERLYTPKKGGFDVTKSTKVARTSVPEVVQTIWGKNYSPSTRITSSVQGITNAIETVRFGTTLARSLAARKLAVKAPNKQMALQQLNKQRTLNRLPLLEEDDLIRVVGATPQNTLLVSGERSFKIKPADDSLIPISNANRIITSAGKNYWTTKEVQKKLTPITDTFKTYTPLFSENHSWGPALETASIKAGELNGSLKIGKTVIAPVTFIRNAWSATVALAATGALRDPLGVVNNFKSLIKTASPGQTRSIFNESRKLGIAGTSIDLNQSLARLGRDLNEDPKFIEKVLSFGLAKFAPKTYNNAMKFYGGTDDFLKTMVYLSEVRTQQRIFTTLTKQEKADSIKLLQSKLGKKVTEEEYIAKRAASNTKDMMPVYSRVPAITESALMRKIPLLGTFSAYPSEMWRNAYNIVRLGSEEMEIGFRTNNTEITKAGASRVMSLYASIAGSTYIANEINDHLDTNDKVKTLTNFLPSWDANSNIVMDTTTKRGNDIIIEYYNVDQSMPYKDMANFVNPLFVSLANGEPAEKVLETFLFESSKSFLTPFAGPSLLADVTNDFINLVSAKEESRLDSAFSLYKSAEPGYVKTIRETAKKLGFFKRASFFDIERAMYPKRFGADSAPSRSLKEFSKVLLSNGINPAGAQTKEVNLTKASSYAARTIYDKYSSGRKVVSNKLTALFSADYDIPTDSDLVEGILTSYENNLQESFVAQQGIRQLYEDITRLSNQSEANRILFENPNVKGAFGNVAVKATIVKNNEHLSNPILSKQKLKTLYYSYKDKPNAAKLFSYLYDTRQNKNGEYLGKILNLEQKYTGISLNKEVPKANEE